MYQRILLAYDGSRAGHEALRQGADLARLCRAEVILLAIVAHEPGVALAEAVTPSDLPVREQEEMEGVLDEGARELRQAGLAVQACLRQGHPAEEIGRLAREKGVDLIVVGHREQGALARWWSGSTGASLLAHAPCSLLVAVATQGGHDPDAGGNGSPNAA
jgi:nucleotide-binding universal stress UspA family protein